MATQGQGAGSGERERWLPWSRILLALAVAGPPLWLGGVKPELVPVFVLVIVALLVRRCLRTTTPLRVPSLWWLGLLAAGLTFVQWLPLPASLLDLLAPGLRGELATIVAGTVAEPWSRLSIHPGQTGLEVARLLALTGLFVASAQLSWRLVAAYVAATGSLVALIGLVQKLVGAQAIYGFYSPRQDVPGLGQELGSPLLTSFVNPNHQSGLLLVGLFAAAATALDLQQRSYESGHARERDRLSDRAFLAWGGAAIQLAALVLSLSRAALVSAIVVTPIALLLALRLRAGGPASTQSRGRRRWLALGSLLVALAVMLVLAARQGATEQLASLRDLDAFEAKFGVAIASLELIPLAPVLGIGRGCFVDLLPLIDSTPSRLQFTHIETTPIAWLVEWGPVPGAVLLLGVGWWAVLSYRSNPHAPRRIALCGLLALAIQSWADFSLDYLGVAAPVVALAGALSASVGQRTWTCKRVLVLTLVLAAAAEAIAIASIPASWSHRRDRDERVLAGELPVDAALEQTPCDPLLHLHLAREHALAGRWSAALARAEVAARLRPDSVEARLIAALAAARAEQPFAALDHLRDALERLREPVAPELLEYLLALLPVPDQLARIAPDSPDPWQALVRALIDRAPEHARVLARERARSFPNEPEPLRVQAVLALRQQNPALALHHARLLVALRPNESLGYRLRAQARFAFNQPAQLDRAVAELQAVLEEPRVDDPGSLEELLVRALLHRRDPASLEQAGRVLERLLARKADREARRRRQALQDELAALRAAKP